MKRSSPSVFVILMLASLASVHAQVKVVTTLNYIRYVAEQVGGSDVSVIALANPRQDPHYVTPTPRMNQTARSADLFIEHGLNLDLWAKNVLDASGNPNIQPGTQGHLVATVNVPVRELPLEVSRAWGDIHPQGNPHCWLDPIAIRIIAGNIAARLAQLDPARTIAYNERLAAFKQRIDEALYGEELLKAVGSKAGDILARKASSGDLESWLESRKLSSKLGGWLERGRKLRNLPVVTYHKTYVYFAERFGLNVVGELEDKPGIPPPPQRRDAVIEQMKRTGARAILNDNFYSREAADYVAQKTGATVIMTYLDVGATPEIATYEHLITYLVDNLLQVTK
jgi:ABC-type Zn uptake system ZnuABC Zn-binding protein ZnuA